MGPEGRKFESCHPDKIKRPTENFQSVFLVSAALFHEINYVHITGTAPALFAPTPSARLLPFLPLPKNSADFVRSGTLQITERKMESADNEAEHKRRSAT